MPQRRWSGPLTVGVMSTSPSVCPDLILFDDDKDRPLDAGDWAEVGSALADLLCDLHSSCSLHPLAVPYAPDESLDVRLRVPGSGEVLARVTQADGYYELSITGGLWEDMVVLQEVDGRLGPLYRAHLRSHSAREREAKDRLLQGFSHLRLVRGWGLNQECLY